jgi:hypothetical protein
MAGVTVSLWALGAGAFDAVAPDVRRKIARVCACVGGAVHGVIFEFDDGNRGGILMSDDCQIILHLDDESIMSRHECRWISVAEPGDYIVSVTGNQLAEGIPDYLCHTLNLQFASGQFMSFASHHLPWRGKEFSYIVTSPTFLVNRIVFQRGRGCQGFDGELTSVHLHVNRLTSEYLPRQSKTKLLLILLIADRVDRGRTAEGESALGEDIWWSILRFFKGYDLLEEEPWQDRKEGTSVGRNRL